MKYSVIIPSYNHSRYIGEAIQSVLNQTLPPYEIIIIDDGSKDASVAICEEWVSRDRRIKLVVQDNTGAHAAINRGLKMSKGDYIAILNSDDVYETNRFEVLLKNVTLDWDIAGSKLSFIDSESRIIPTTRWLKKAVIANRLFGNNIISLAYANYFMTTSNFLFKRSLLDRIGFFNDYRYCHDLDFLIRASRETRVLYIDQSLLRYRFHQTNTVREGVDKVLTEAWTVIVKNLNGFSSYKRRFLTGVLALVAILNSQFCFFSKAYKVIQSGDIKQ